MRVRKRFLLLYVVLLLLVCQFPERALASTDTAIVPPGFYLIDSAGGIELYRKDYQGGNPDYVQVVDLLNGGQVQLLHGEIRDYQEGQGVFGGRDAKIVARPLQQFWNELAAVEPGAFCVLNGQFFKMGETPTRLPFSLKINGEIISDGYEKNEHTDQKLMLEIWGNRVDIRELSMSSLYSSTAPNIIAGLTEDGRKSPQKYVARTFVGIDDRNNDGRSETVLIFNTKSARQKDAAGVLREFGADKVMMLDGGGSTQLICNHSVYIASDRAIPQAIAVIAGGNPVTAVESTGFFSFSSTREENTTASQSTLINLSDIKWVLFALLPVVLILVLAISRIQQRVYY